MSVKDISTSRSQLSVAVVFAMNSLSSHSTVTSGENDVNTGAVVSTTFIV